MTTQIGALAVLASMTLFLLGLAFTVGIDPYFRRITGASAIPWRTTRNVREGSKVACEYFKGGWKEKGQTDGKTWREKGE